MTAKLKSFLNSSYLPALKKSQAGFTVVELLVVFAIIVLLSSVIIINWNGQTPARSLTIAQNEVVTNIRKVQSYAVTSRNINSTVPAKFYYIKFQKNQRGYTISGSDASSTPVFYSDLESLNLPTGLTVSNIALASTDGTSNLSPDCVMLTTSVIYGKTYFLADLCNSTVMTTVYNPAQVAQKSNYVMTLTLTHTLKNVSKTVVVYGLTGRVEAN